MVLGAQFQPEEIFFFLGLNKESLESGPQGTKEILLSLKTLQPDSNSQPAVILIIFKCRTELRVTAVPGVADVRFN